MMHSLNALNFPFLFFYYSLRVLRMGHAVPSSLAAFLRTKPQRDTMEISNNTIETGQTGKATEVHSHGAILHMDLLPHMHRSEPHAHERPGQHGTRG